MMITRDFILTCMGVESDVLLGPVDDACGNGCNWTDWNHMPEFPNDPIYASICRTCWGMQSGNFAKSNRANS